MAGSNGHSNGHNGTKLAFVHALEAAGVRPAPTGPPGLEICDGCGTKQRKAESGNHYAVHFAKPTDRAPCPRSWPPKPTLKAAVK